jgi:hypothetical protein
MRFRRIYWVTEQLDERGRSQVTGVYTSVPDLVDRGIQWREGCTKRDGFRLTLVQLDSSRLPLGVWTSPAFDGIEEDLQAFVQSEELTVQDCELLVTKLKTVARRP